jgi:hypothetical protein
VVALAGLVLAQAPLVITTASLPTATVGKPYSTTLTASGGAPPLIWSVASGALPPGISVSSGGLVGYPTTAGTYSLTLQVTDSLGKSDRRSYTLTVLERLVFAGGFSFPQVGQPFSARLPAQGGSPPYFFAVVAGGLPPGISLDSSSGTLSGTPYIPGKFPVTFQVTDRLGSSATWPMEFMVDPEPMRIECHLPDHAHVGLNYYLQFRITGGLPPITMKVLAGSVPPGLALTFPSPVGQLSGMPTTVGDYAFQVEATDAGQTSIQFWVNVRVLPPLPIFALVQAPLKGTVGVPFRFVPTVSGGVPPLRFRLKEPSTLPPGLSLVLLR